jgi:hypothetical protein
LGFANHAYLAVRAPAGRYRLDLVYRPRSFDLGLAASALGAVASAALLARGRRGRPVGSRR